MLGMLEDNIPFDIANDGNAEAKAVENGMQSTYKWLKKYDF